MLEGRVEVASGVVLAVRRWDPTDARLSAAGEGSGGHASRPDLDASPDPGHSPFLLVHGLASNARTWDGVAARLAAQGHPVVAIDQRGHGLSDKPDDGYDYATVTGDLAAAIDALGLERPVVVGQSWGGDVVLELAARHPSTVRGVACVDGGLIELSRAFPDWETCAEALAPPRLDGMPAVELEARIRSGRPDWSDAAIGATMANFEVRADGTVVPRLTRERHMRILRAMWEHSPWAALAAVRAPVLLLPADTGDAAWTAGKRAATERAVASRPGVTARWFAPADHDIHLQHPDELAGVLHDATLDGSLA
jgi:pimeloyl-ACP methyl ester carboxylesterase